MNLDHILIFDHHAHPLLPRARTADASGFLPWFTESRDPDIHRDHVPNTLLLRTALRWLAEELECEPSLDAVLAARSTVPEEAWTRRLFDDANIGTVCCDYGYGGGNAFDHSQMQVALPCRVESILRLETLAESLILAHATFDEMVGAFEATVARARTDGHIAFKSIIAYRSGLDITPTDRVDAASAFRVFKEQAERGGRIRLDAKPLCDYLVEIALVQAEKNGLPVQFHTGFGDKDADLRHANPLHLRDVIERFPRAQFVLLHAGWPYYRETAHLAALYANVWLDLSLAVPFATAGIPAMMRDVLGMAPHSKVLIATDAFTMPEIYWIAARWGRWGLGRVLEEFVGEGWLDLHQADQAAERILHRNAQRLYST